MREQKVDALVVVFAVEGVPSIAEDSITCITSSVEEANSRLWNFRLDGHGFTAITPIRITKAKVMQKQLGQMLMGSQHIY